MLMWCDVSKWMSGQQFDWNANVCQFVLTAIIVFKIHTYIPVSLTHSRLSSTQLLCCYCCSIVGITSDDYDDDDDGAHTILFTLQSNGFISYGANIYTITLLLNLLTLMLLNSTQLNTTRVALPCLPFGCIAFLLPHHFIWIQSIVIIVDVSLLPVRSILRSCIFYTDTKISFVNWKWLKH